jgi:predicted nucleic acid-binding protein
MSPTLADSNILLSAAQPLHPHHSIVLTAVTRLLQQNVDLCIVTQNLVEFWVVATRPVGNYGFGMSPAAAGHELSRLRTIFRLLDGGVGIADAWEKLVSQHLVSGKQSHDAHLAAAMGVYGVKELLTFNGKDFKRFPNIMVLDPAQV